MLQMHQLRLGTDVIKSKPRQGFFQMFGATRNQELIRGGASR